MEFLLLDDRENLKLAIIRKLEQQYSLFARTEHNRNQCRFATLWSD